ncbi:MAG: hypothetical protein J6I56_05670 [Lachnospiraceae bacterium]|nr:hypothetical protein [Lachnospiraceae bacterium]
MDQEFDTYQDNRNARKRDPALNMAKGAMFLGICSLIATLFVPIAMPLFFAPIAIVIALISRADRRTLHPQAAIAVATSVVAIVFNLLLFVVTALTIWRAITDPAFREQLNAVLVQMDGRTLEEIFAQYGAAIPLS